MKKGIIITVAVIVVVAVGIYLANQSSKPVVSNDLAAVPGDNDLKNNMAKAGLDVLSAEGTVLHIHEHIDIIINGEAKTIPGHIGIGTTFISPLHTHDTTGVLHVESPVVKDFHLGQFFTEWGMNFDDSHIAGYTADDNNKLIIAVNGKQITDAANYVLKPHDEIEIWYGPKSENPGLISSYTFAAGL